MSFDSSEFFAFSFLQPSSKCCHFRCELLFDAKIGIVENSKYCIIGQKRQKTTYPSAALCLNSAFAIVGFVVVVIVDVAAVVVAVEEGAPASDARLSGSIVVDFGDSNDDD